MGRSRGKRSRARKHGTWTHQPAAAIESDPDLEVDLEGSEVASYGDHVEPPVDGIRKKKEKAVKQQAVAAPQPQRELSTTLSVVHVDEPRIVPLMVGDHEYKIAMSRVQIEPDNYIWAVKLCMDDYNMDCRCQFHQQMRRASDVIRENSV